MRIIAILLFLVYASNTYAGWVDDVGILERPTTPTAKPNMGIVWVDKLTKDLMFLDSDGLQYNILLGGGIGGAKLNDLSDVDTFTASPTVGQTLIFDGSLWKPGDNASTLAGLSDVDLVTVPPTANKVLGFDGTKWVPAMGGKTLVAGQGVTIIQDATTATFSSSGKDLVAGNGISIVQDATTATISSSGKVLVGTAPVTITQDATTATFSFTQDASNRLTTDAEKTAWNAKVDGTGSSNAIAKWSATSTLTDSTITDDGTTVRTTADLQIDAGKYQYFGDPTVNNSFRIYQNAGSLVIEKRISGSWSEAIRVE